MKIPARANLLRRPSRQRGMGAINLIFILAVCGIVVLLGLKLFSPYNQFFSVKSVISAMANSEEVRSGTVAEIRRSFDRRAAISYIEAISGDDLEITKEGGETVVIAAWQARVPLFTGYTLLIDFSASTADK